MIKKMVLFLFAQLVCSSAQSTFTTQPMSVRQAEGLNALFECLYPGATAYSWAINGTFLSVFPPDITAISSSGDSPASLTIPAIPQYNNTVVQCEAVVRVGGGFESVLSENATLVVQAQTTFTTQPMSVARPEGLEAVFECLHPGASHTWFVNGIHQTESSFPQNVLIVVSLTGNSPARLTITAIPQYNNTVVQCEATVRVGGRPEFVLSENATLLVQGPLTSISNLQLASSTTSITITWNAPFSLDLTDVEPDIQYCVDVYDFTAVDVLVESICDITDEVYNFSPDNPDHTRLLIFTITPRSNVPGALNGTTSEPVTGIFVEVIMRQAEGLEAVFECLHPGAIAYSWAINGTFQSDLPPDITSVSPSGDSPATLTIPAIPQYNNTSVQCEAVVRVGGRPEFVLSSVAVLIVQGPLMAVSNLSVSMTSSSITMSWDAPFSLNLTDVEPDIEYCVNVYNITVGDDLVESECDIILTSFTFTPDNPSPDHLFNFTVTPRSNVPGAINGTSELVQGYTLREPLTIPSERIQLVFDVTLNPFRITFPVQVLGTSPGRMPTSYTVELVYIDFTQQRCSCPTEHTMENDEVVLTLRCDCDCNVKSHRLLHLTILVQNNAGVSRSTPAKEISTHDVQMMEANYSSFLKQLNITCSYLDGSTGRGFFTIVFSPENISYRVAHRNELEPVTSLIIDKIQNMNNMVAVYDLRTSGLPEDRPAATPRGIVFSNNITIPSSPPETINPPTMSSLQDQPKVTSPSGGKVCINCSFSDTKAIGCVGVIHSAQLDNLTLTILPVERSVGMNCTEETLNEGEYFVAVFGQLADGLEEVPVYVAILTVESSPTPTIIDVVIMTNPSFITILGVVLAVVVVAMVVLIGIIIVCVCIIRVKRKTKRSDLTSPDQSHDRGAPIVDGRVDWSTTFAGIEQPNEAYSLVLKKNAAYEKAKPRRQRNQQRQPGQPLAPVEENAESERVDMNTVPHKYEEVTIRDEQSPLTTQEMQQGTENGVEYMNNVPCDYEQMVPQQQQHPVGTTQEIRVGGMEEGEYMNTVALQKDTKYENVVPQGAPHKAYVNLDIPY